MIVRSDEHDIQFIKNCAALFFARYPNSESHSILDRVHLNSKGGVVGKLKVIDSQSNPGLYIKSLIELDFKNFSLWSEGDSGLSIRLC